MKRIIIAATGSLALVAILGCGGAGMMGGAAGAGNQAACQKYVEKHNSQPCLKMAPLDAAQMCIAGLDQSPVNMVARYECMAENTKCNGDIPDLGGIADCNSL